ncbi:ABC transporter ATP-binding protein [Lactobacillus sp. LC28-10]|uniref:ABC transporter ATP-binding protein n=1 Tax=Secundilactobacillus angelensis TaxID=2722706 RepID=A0ABX1KYF4_9LACO|nr:ABC transporter ATP-binding protein [Secundilactobacillus angelensis]MCH5462338.1 energy-coupling factor ABC transporter ATP-binding protein [Secundilactobacillus angelensis]NLR18180.1 ABC transporter ATP-binding protein [Secundilactobacillus angelensis]
MATISINHLSFSYPTEDGQKPLTLADVSATFPDGGFSLLTGPSGSGKSTLMKIMSGLYPKFGGVITHGEIQLNHTPISEIPETDRGQLIAMMFQNPNQQFAMDTVERELLFTLENQCVPPSEMMSRVDRALEYVEITALRHRQLNSLSGGEKQKVALAVIIAMKADTILLDEPFASVDPVARQLLLSKLAKLQHEEHKTIIISDHDLEDYDAYIDHLFVLNGTGNSLTLLNETDAQEKMAAFQRQDTSDQQLSLPTKVDQPVITAHDLSLTAGTSTLLKQPEINFFKHHITLLTGANGTGKSTLLMALSKLHQYDGTLLLNQKEIAKIRNNQLYRQVALVFQDADQQFLNVSVAEELALSLKNSQAAAYFKERLPGFLEKLQLDHLQDHVVYTLSGGQKKKLQILEMLIMATPVLLFDEPFTGLDFSSLQTIMAIMKQVAHDCHQTMLIVSHQLFGLDALVDYHVTLANNQLQYVEGLA